MSGLSSRERMLRALSGQPVDHTPCCFMLLHSLDEWWPDETSLIEKQLEWGLDPLVVVPSWSLTRPGDPQDLQGYQHDYPAKINVTLRGLPVHCHPTVRVREWVTQSEGERYPWLHKEYITPAGTLSVIVNQTADWPYGDRMLFVDDFIIARARKNLIATAQDLQALPYLLLPPDQQVINHFRAAARANRQLAKARGLLLVYHWGVLADMAAWLCGLEQLIFLAHDEPQLLASLLQIIADWNLARMKVVLDEGIDLWVRRGWYEGCDFWSPKLYRQFILPHLKQEAAFAHSRGVKFGYILTKGAMPLLDMLVEAGVDVLIGVDPVQGDLDLQAITVHRSVPGEERVRGKMCLWGGVNGPLTVEAGSAGDIRAAVKHALDVLSPGNGFILSPVDGIYDTSAQTRRNVQVFIDAWKEWR